MLKFLKSLMNAQVKDAIKLLIIAVMGAVLERLLGIIDAALAAPGV